MLKKILAILAMLYAAASFAAVDVNKATAAELDAVKGIGPSISTKILDERKKGSFMDWLDFIDRVKGVGEHNAVKLSSEGLTVNGSTFKGAAATPAKAESKDAQAVAKDEKKDAKATAKAEKKAAKEKAKEEKAAAKATAKAETKAAEAKKDAKVEKADAKKDAKEAKADAKADAAAKPVAAAASSAKAASAKK